MNNITSDKMFGYIERIQEGHNRPITADVFITNYCNNNCPYCTYKRWELGQGARFMRYVDFVMYAGRMREIGVQGLILTGGGEPILNPDFLAITGWLEIHSFPYGINTNFNKFEKFKPNYMKVSLDGYDPESYRMRRGVDAYERVVQNIKEYAEWAREESPETTIGIQCIAEDVDWIKRFYETNCVLDVDYIVFRPVESTGGRYYTPEYRKAMARRIVATIKELAEIDSRVTLNFKWNMLNWREKDCSAQWAQIAVNELGEVMYCCHKPYEIVGFIMDDDILEKKARATTDISMCDVPCRMTAPNNFVAQVLKERKDPYFI